jgi:CubicO group peptidase (beta-lactamase class C family)
VRKSTTTRRRFLQASGTLIAANASLTAAKAMAHTSPGQTTSHVQSTPKQSEDGIVFHRDLHKSSLKHGFPPPRDKRVTIHNWHRDTDTVRYTHLHEDRVFTTTAILPDNTRVWTLPRRMIDPERLARAAVLWGPTEKEAERIRVSEWLERSQTDAFIAIHDGHIVAEAYFGEMSPQTRHSVWSSSKSVIAIIMAGLMAEKKLNEQDLVTEHIPELSGSAFDKATFRQVFDQTTGVELKTFPGPRELEKMTAAQRKAYDFGSPEHRRADHENARLLRAIGCFPPLPQEGGLGMYDFILTLKKTRDHGACFYYADANPITAQWLLGRITGTDFVDHMSSLWPRLGAEHVATLKLDQIGTAVGTVGLAMTARDYARLGLMLLNRGRVGTDCAFPGIGDLVDGLKRDPGPERWTNETNFLGQTRPGNGYKSFFWTFVDGSKGEVIPFVGGLHGQRVYFDNSRNVVLAKLSTRLGHSREEEVACPSFVQLLPQLVR